MYVGVGSGAGANGATWDETRTTRSTPTALRCCRPGRAATPWEVGAGLVMTRPFRVRTRPARAWSSDMPARSCQSSRPAQGHGTNSNHRGSNHDRGRRPATSRPGQRDEGHREHGGSRDDDGRRSIEPAGSRRHASWRGRWWRGRWWHGGSWRGRWWRSRRGHSVDAAGPGEHIAVQGHLAVTHKRTAMHHDPGVHCDRREGEDVAGEDGTGSEASPSWRPARTRCTPGRR